MTLSAPDSAPVRSGEVGLGIDLSGEKFCYAGECVYSGFTLDVPQVGADFNVVVSGWKSMSAVPGRSNMMAFGLGGELPDSAIPDFDVDLTLVTGGAKMSNILGVSKAFGGGQDASEVSGDGQLRQGYVYTLLGASRTKEARAPVTRETGGISSATSPDIRRSGLAAPFAGQNRSRPMGLLRSQIGIGQKDAQRNRIE